MPELVETVIEDNHWNDVGLNGLAQGAARATLGHLGLDAAGFAIALLGCSDARMRDLNAAFRDKPAPTNVLSWPSAEFADHAPGQSPALPEAPGGDSPAELGDIAIAWETCRREAEAAGKPISAHATHLLVHATLHLLGYDHICDEDAALMERLEAEILASLGHQDPYCTE